MIYCLKNGSSVPTLVKLDKKFRFCNGIAFQGKNTILVAETMTRSIIAFDIKGPGELMNRRLWAKLPEGESLCDPGPAFAS